MPTPRFSIGIDLGTTNCALAFVPLDGEAKSDILGLPQWETLSGITESSALPSFLYLPDEAVADQIKGEAATKEEWVSPELVERAYETFRRFDWGAPELAEMPVLFLRAARVVGNRSFDLPKARRHQIAAELENIGIAPQKTAKLKEFMPVGGSEQISLHDESLPAGLILTES